MSELAADPNLFLLVHQHLATILHQLEARTTDQAVTGQPLKNSVPFDEARIALFREIFSQFEPGPSRLLLSRILAGRGLTVTGERRELCRRAAHALALLLPANTRGLSFSSDAACKYQLLIKAADGLRASYSFSGPSCSCRDREAAGSGGCPECSNAWSSSVVGTIVSILASTDMNSCTVHSRLLATVEGTLHNATIWSKLRSDSDKKSFLRKFGLGQGDEDILNFFSGQLTVS